MTSCPVCAAPLAVGLRDWHRVCAACGYEGSTLPVRILDPPAGSGMDEDARIRALEPLRRSNFSRLAALIAAAGIAPAGRDGCPRLLDVGCAHGWFLEEVGSRFDAVGIEPEAAVAAATRARGLDVRDGFFPGMLAADERFDVIAFNDVLEHIPDVDAALAACARHLHPGGLLVVNAPDRLGTLYRIARLMLRAGAPGSFERMWQKGFPSPHVHYFDRASLDALAARHGLRPYARARLATVTTAGLYSRVRLGGDVSAPKALVITAAVAAAAPLLALLPPDIVVALFRRDAGPVGPPG